MPVDDCLVNRIVSARDTRIGSLSDSLSRPKLDITNFDALLKDAELGKDLVHSAYYSEPECISMIARWLARTEHEILHESAD